MMILTILFFCLFFSLGWGLIKFAIKLAWGLTKVVFVIALPAVILIGLVAYGLLYIAFPLLIIGGIVFLVKDVIK